MTDMARLCIYIKSTVTVPNGCERSMVLDFNSHIGVRFNWGSDNICLLFRGGGDHCTNAR